MWDWARQTPRRLWSELYARSPLRSSRMGSSTTPPTRYALQRSIWRMPMGAPTDLCASAGLLIFRRGLRRSQLDSGRARPHGGSASLRNGEARSPDVADGRAAVSCKCYLFAAWRALCGNTTPRQRGQHRKCDMPRERCSKMCASLLLTTRPWSRPRATSSRIGRCSTRLLRRQATASCHTSAASRRRGKGRARHAKQPAPSRRLSRRSMAESRSSVARRRANSPRAWMQNLRSSSR